MTQLESERKAVLDDPSGIEKLVRATDFSLDSLGEAREEIVGVIRGPDETFCCIKFFAKLRRHTSTKRLRYRRLEKMDCWKEMMIMMVETRQIDDDVSSVVSPF